MKSFAKKIIAILCFIIISSVQAPAHAGAPQQLSLIDDNSNVSFQIRLSAAHKKLLNDMAAKLLKDPDLIKSVPEFKSVLESSMVEFFFKTAFEAVLKDLSLISFSYAAESAGSQEYSSKLIFTFENSETPLKIYNTNKDIFDIIYSGSSEIKVSEENPAGFKIATAALGGKAAETAIMAKDNHLAVLFSNAPSREKHIAAAGAAEKLVSRYAKKEKSLKYGGEGLLKDFNEDAGFFFNADLKNFASEDTAAAELFKEIFIGAKLEDDFSVLDISSLLRSVKAAPGAGRGTARKTFEAALSLLKAVRPPSPSFASLLPEDISLMIGFNLNFSDEFLAITDVFVFRGLLLTATGIDYKDDMLSWFDGGASYALGKINIGPEAFSGGAKIEIPQMYLGLKSKNQAAAEKFIEKISRIIEENITGIKVSQVKSDGVKASKIKISAPLFNEFDIIFGLRGDYLLITTSMDAFKNVAAAEKNAAKRLDQSAYFKSGGAPLEGHFFSLYINGKAAFSAFDNFLKIKPELKLITAFPMASYSSSAAFTGEGDIKTRARISIDAEKFSLIMSKFSVANIVKYFNMLDKLLK